MILTQSYNEPLQASSFLDFASSVGFELASAALQSSSFEPNLPCPVLYIGGVERKLIHRKADAIVDQRASNHTSLFSHRIDHHSGIELDDVSQNGGGMDGITHQDTYPVEPVGNTK